MITEMELLKAIEEAQINGKIEYDPTNNYTDASGITFKFYKIGNICYVKGYGTSTDYYAKGYNIIPKNKLPFKPLFSNIGYQCSWDSPQKYGLFMDDGTGVLIGNSMTSNSNWHFGILYLIDDSGV